MEILERRPYAYRTSFPLDEALVRFPDGSQAMVLVKELSRSALDERGRRAKPDFVYDPLREIEVYTEILDDRELGTARCYGAVAVPEEDRYLLFLEKVDGAELWQKGELEAWEGVARWAARLHRDVEPPKSPHLVRYDAEYLRQWIDRALSFWGGAELECIAASYDAVVERLAALPRVFVHGELYASNVLVSGPRVCAVDWEMAGVGPGVLDLAALASAWGDEDVALLAGAYGDVLGRSVEREDLDGARFHLAVQWLGWSREWTPPCEHATDWLGEAVRAAERLGLCGAS
jgi:hypothetical protein